MRCIGWSVCAALCALLLSLAPQAAAAEHGAPAAGGDDPAAAWRAYIARRAVPLPDPDDMSSLLPVLASRDLVLLGETTHGTHEYYAWRSRISKMLIARAGFRFIAVEGDWSAISRLDRYVRHLCAETPSARSALRTFDRWAEWMWANPVLEELAEWLRAHNAGRPPDQRAGIHGMDVYGWDESAAGLPNALDALEPGWGERAAGGLAPLLRIGGDQAAFYRAVARGESVGGDKLERILERLHGDADALRARDAEAWLQAERKASLIRQVKQHVRKSLKGNPRSWNPRAENFMHTVVRLRSHYGAGARGIVWAHNTHIGDARQTGMAGAGLITIGQRARETLGEARVFLLGFASDRGSFRAGRAWGQPGVVMDLPTASDGTFDAFLRDAAPERAFLPLAEARANPLLLEPLGHRAIGVVHAPGTPASRNYVPSVVPLRYDGILFIRDTRALDCLEAE